MKYFVFYVKECSPRVKSFESLNKARVFAEKLDRKKNDDNWVETIIKGEFVDFFENGMHLLKDLAKK
jgi:hypothetical protein